MSIQLGEVVAALSFAADLALGQPMEHALRTAILAVQLGKRLGLAREDLRDAYFLALLRSIGCNAESDVVSAVFVDENQVNGWLSHVQMGRPVEVLRAVVGKVAASEPILRRAGAVLSTLARLPGLNGVAPAHCEVAQLLAARMGFSKRIQRGLGQVYERWDGKGLPHGIRGAAIDRVVRVVNVARDVELAHRTAGIDGAVNRLRERRDAAYDPEVVDAFLAAPDTVVAVLEVPSIWAAAANAEPEPREVLVGERLDAVLRAFGEFVDVRSRYTRGHSAGVASLAEAAGRRLGLGEEDAVTLRRAGWVHDVGMSSVPVSIVEKPAGLSDTDFERVRMHSYYTDRILHRPPGLALIGEIAAAAHERLDGNGYHRRLPRTAVAIAARILAAADAFQAMTEDRAHRKALSAQAAAGQLCTEVEAGRLDKDAVEAVLAAAGQHMPRARTQNVAGLSEREIQVLRQVALGLTNKEVAQRLSLTPKTVGNHLQNIYPKIGVTTRAGATMFAMQNDLLDFN